MAFAHLHLHTAYSLLDGACRIEPLMDRIAALGQTSVAMTDHGVLYGAVAFYRAAKERGLHPVLGCEVYVAPGSRFEKTAAAREYAHLILLCENQAGWQNLMKLSSAGFTEGFYYKPRIDYELLAQHAEGLICLSACLSGDIPRLIMDGRMDDARKLALRLRAMFGEHNFFFEIQENGIPEQRTVNQGLLALSQELGIPLVATNDVHYLLREDAPAHEILLCVQTNTSIDDPNHMRFSNDSFYVKSESEMLGDFAWAKDAVHRSQEIAERCHVTFDFKSIYLPKYQLQPGEVAEEKLRTLCEDGMRRLYGETPSQEARDRLEYELRVIISMGYVEYFLITWDFIKYAKDHGILVGPGRGSGAGSIVAYTLGITGIDPLAYGLLFERFLNPERISMPDLDIDFCYQRRQEVIDYVTERYGHDHVCQIITFGTMGARGVLRDVGRAMGLSYGEVDVVAKAVPWALEMTLDKAVSASPELRKAIEADPRIAGLVDTARRLEGLPRHASTHAAGVIITAAPAVEYIPLQTNDEVVTTQFDMGDVERLGLLKMDFLGLRTLTVLRDTLVQLQRDGIALALDDIPLDDPETYAMLATGDTDGVFQLESAGMRRVIAELGPHSIEEITAVISLYRPGPMESIPKYIAGKLHPETVTYTHPSLEPILSLTYGCMVYQEQVMQIVRDLAGYSYGRSDLVRRAMAKKKRDVMEQERQYFIHGMTDDAGNITLPGAVRGGVPEGVANRIFEEMSSFAAYAFNKSHAAAYALIAYQTAYLKRHYPVAFFAATMNSFVDSTDKVAAYIQTCRGRGIAVLPPSVNASAEQFTVDGGAIRFGLVGVKNVGRPAVEAIMTARKRAPFEDLYDFCDRVDATAINKRAVESLIKAGAFDGMGATRGQMLVVYEKAIDGAADQRRRMPEGQTSLFGDATLARVRPPWPVANAMERAYDHRMELAMEKEVTGIYLSGHPLDDARALLASQEYSAADIASFAEEPDAIERYDRIPLTLSGMVAGVRRKTTRKNDLMAFIQLEDLTGIVEGLVFPRVLEEQGALLLPDAMVTIGGRLSLQEDKPPTVLVEQIVRLGEPLPELKPRGGGRYRGGGNGAPPVDPAFFDDPMAQGGFGPPPDGLPPVPVTYVRPKASVVDAKPQTPVCPLCGSSVQEGTKGFACARWKEGCAFVIPKQALARDGTAADGAALRQAIADGRWAGLCLAR